MYTNISFTFLSLTLMIVNFMMHHIYQLSQIPRYFLFVELNDNIFIVLHICIIFIL